MTKLQLQEDRIDDCQKSHISREERMKHQMKDARMCGVTKRIMPGEERKKKSIVRRQRLLLSAKGTA